MDRGTMHVEFMELHDLGSTALNTILIFYLVVPQSFSPLFLACAHNFWFPLVFVALNRESFVESECEA